ncbi:MAG: DsbA family oxidoreductase [Pseudomonadota bacterium]|jgi:predicted DsbA family dithiol-disulfide isomerase
MHATSGKPVQVDVYFDLICPWCWIGKTHLSTARRLLAQQAPGVQVQLRWHSVQLIPQVPPQGWPYQAFYEQRLGGPEAVRLRRAQVQAAAARAGLTMQHERIAVFPNTWRAHRLLAYSAQQQPDQPDRHEALLDALFEAFFVQGLDIGDSQVLAQLAQAHGVDSTEAEAFDAPPVWSMPDDTSGVPLFVFNQRQVVSGAQPPEVLLAAMLAAHQSAGLSQD